MDLSTIAGIALLGIAGYSQKDRVVSLVKGGIAYYTGGSSTAPARAEAIASLDGVIAYLESIHCPEGVAAARLVGPHFWHAHKPDAPGGAV